MSIRDDYERKLMDEQREAETPLEPYPIGLVGHGVQDIVGSMTETPKQTKLNRNRVRCLKCEEIIESQHRHDFVTCKCGNISVDGGMSYMRRIGTLKDYEEKP